MLDEDISDESVDNVTTHKGQNSNKAFRHAETLFIQGRPLVPNRPAIGGQGLFTLHQPIAGLLGIRFLPWTNKVSTRRKVRSHFQQRG